MNESLIRQVPLFASLPAGDIRQLAATLDNREFAANTILFVEAEYGERFYIVIDGQVEIIKGWGTADERLVGMCGPGEYVGEMSLLNPDGLRTATARTLTPVRALEMHRAGFNALLSRQPNLAYEMVRVLSMRLQEAHDGALSELKEKNRQLQQAYQELKAAQARIIEQEMSEHELQLARRIQMSLLPHRLPRLHDFDVGMRIAPMQAVGGDFYDFIPLDDGRMGIAVGDVSGHGVPAALFMAMTATLLRAEACRDCSPAAVLRGVNRQLLAMNREGMFVTILYGILDTGMHTFTYARAGHEAPIVVNGNGQLLTSASGQGQFLGVFPDPLLDEQTTPLLPGSTLLLYTDGVVEAMNADGELFGERKLQQAACVASHSSAQAVCDQILDCISAYRSAAPQQDDIMLVCLRAR